eukprot:Nk52_evm1s452 gene=Nk52_evmTU1s452
MKKAKPWDHFQGRDVVERATADKRDCDEMNRWIPARDMLQYIAYACYCQDNSLPTAIQHTLMYVNHNLANGKDIRRKRRVNAELPAVKKARLREREDVLFSSDEERTMIQTQYQSTQARDALSYVWRNNRRGGRRNRSGRNGQRGGRGGREGNRGAGRGGRGGAKGHNNNGSTTSQNGGGEKV